MNFSQQHGSLPQFSELTSRANTVQISTTYSANSSHILVPQNAIYTNASPESDKQTLLANTSNKYPGSLLGWSHSGLMQFCDKSNIQSINIPNYSQNNPLLGVSSSSFPVRLLQNAYLPTSSSQVDEITIKEEPVLKQDSAADESDNNELDSSTQLQLQNAVVAEYLQKLQAGNLPTTWQQLIKLQSDPARKDKDDDSKIEPLNNILNIPCVPGFRNNVPNGNSYLTSELMPDINPSDLNIHIESASADEISISSQSQPPQAPQPQPLATSRSMVATKVEQHIQTDSPKTERKVKFRAKTGEIKIAMSLDGSMVYCCPECNLPFFEKTEIEQHIQLHIQERKYECKECGAMLKRKEHLDQHMRGHSDERPFKCPVCQKAFKRNEHLTRHYVIHSGDKNFTCNVCQKAFSRKDHLNKHTQTHMNLRRSKAKKEPVICDIKEMDPVLDISKHELSYLLKDANLMKQDSTFYQHIQHLQKDQSFVHTFANFKGHVKDSVQQQAVNMNEILPQNTRYLLPS